jgi:hypothetical protein
MGEEARTWKEATVTLAYVYLIGQILIKFISILRGEWRKIFHIFPLILLQFLLIGLINDDFIDAFNIWMAFEAVTLGKDYK